MKANPNHHFIISIIYVLAIPLLPIIYELIATQDCLDTTILITSAIYPLTVFSTSKRFIDFIYSVFLFGLMCFFYGQRITANYKSEGIKEIFNGEKTTLIEKFTSEYHDWVVLIVAVFVIIITITFHTKERWKRHKVNDETFLEFYN